MSSITTRTERTATQAAVEEGSTAALTTRSDKANRSGGQDGDTGGLGPVADNAPGASVRPGQASVVGRASTVGGDNYAAQGALGASGTTSGWRESDLGGDEEGSNNDAGGAGNGPQTFGVQTTPQVRAALSDPKLKDFGKWVNEKYAAGDPDVKTFVDRLAGNDSSSAGAAAAAGDSRKAALESDSEAKQSAGAAGASSPGASTVGGTSFAATGGVTAGAASASAPGTNGATGAGPATGYGNFGNTGESWAAADAKKLYAKFQDSVIQRASDDRDNEDEKDKKDGKKAGGSKAGAAGAGKGGKAAAGGEKAGAAGDSPDSASGADDGTGDQSYTSSSADTGFGGLSGMELVQAVMLEAAAEASKSAEDIARTVQQNTAQKNELRGQVDALRTSLSGVTPTNMSSAQSADNTKMSNLSDQMDSIGDDNQILFIRLQNASQQYTTMLQGCSNVSKNLYDIDKSVIGNIGH